MSCSRAPRRCASSAGWRFRPVACIRWAMAWCRRRKPPSTATRPSTRTSAYPGSHLGLGFNGIVLAVVADRLAQPEGAWQPFASAGPARPRVARHIRNRGRRPGSIRSLTPTSKGTNAPTQRTRRRLHLFGQRPRQFQRNACCTSTTSLRRRAAWCASSRSWHTSRAAWAATAGVPPEDPARAA
jgi:hypothetical protein